MKTLMRKTAAVLGPAWAAKMRKDFLTLVGNVPRVESLADLTTLMDGFRKYRQVIHNTIYTDMLNNEQWKHDHGPSWKFLDNLLRSVTWDFYLALNPPFLGNREGEAQLHRWNEEKAAWERKVRSTAQAFWKAVKQVEDTPTAEPEQHVEEIEDFKVKVVGNRDKDWLHSTAIGKLRAALRAYRKSAQRHLPWLLKNNLPLVINMVANASSVAASYERDHVVVYLSALTGEIEDIVKVFAHEMGHHLWAHLGADAQEFWRHAYLSDYGKVDVADFLADWPESDRYTSTHATNLQDSDPVRALQLYMLQSGFADQQLHTRSDFQDLLDSGTTTVMVPKTPITEYAAKNEEEAFCETVGMLVGFGPRTLDPLVLHWLETTIPGQSHIASYVPSMTKKASIHPYARRIERTAAEAKKVDDLVEELTEVLDKNVKDDGEVTEYDPPAFLKDEVEETEERSKRGPRPNPYFNIFGPMTPGYSKFDGSEDEPDVSDLDTDFDWEFYDKMYPGRRNWPVRDTAILYDPAAISRYNVDYFRLVARVAKVAKVLQALSRRRLP